MVLPKLMYLNCLDSTTPMSPNLTTHVNDQEATGEICVWNNSLELFYLQTMSRGSFSNPKLTINVSMSKPRFQTRNQNSFTPLTQPRLV